MGEASGHAPVPRGIAVTDSAEIERAVAAHDAKVMALGLDIWVGNEPTFTDRYSQATEWLTGAVGDDKQKRAEGLVAALAQGQPGGAILRSIGRQYPGETTPRTSIGLYARRDGRAVWSGPPDPLLSGTEGFADLASFHRCLPDGLLGRGFAHVAFVGPAGDLRHVCARGGQLGAVLPDPTTDPRLWRPSIHSGAIPPEGLRDDLAREGLFLLILGETVVGGRVVACCDLPAIEDVDLFLELLSVLGEVARRSQLPCLVLRGFPPPVGTTVSWSTVTPDPAVVEVNTAPDRSVEAFLRSNRVCYAAAAALGLHPYRLYYNGSVADSGGGGQITFGGPSPARSPFFVVPQLLPRLVRYVTRHPSISYLFAHDHIGPSGQSVRPDELGTDAHAESRLAMALLAREPEPTPSMIWETLAPFLTDPTGNSHRAEINVEKLWNFRQPGRGMLGLVEFRAFRMQHTPERVAALAALLRAVLARLMVSGQDLDRSELVSWGSELHERFSLPFYLETDLREVLADLERAGLGLEPALASELAADHWRHMATYELGNCTLTIRRALEFWMLIGDATDQRGTSRLVDASTSRIEIVLRPTWGTGGPTGVADWRLRVNDIDLPLRAESDGGAPVRVFGVRSRVFVPGHGLHPTLGSQTPLRILLIDSARPGAQEITVHEWAPDGAAYPDLPADLEQASLRRAARCVLRSVPPEEVRPALKAPPGACGPYALDLRYPSVSVAGAGNPI